MPFISFTDGNVSVGLLAARASLLSMDLLISIPTSQCFLNCWVTHPAIPRLWECSIESVSFCRGGFGLSYVDVSLEASCMILALLFVPLPPGWASRGVWSMFPMSGVVGRVDNSGSVSSDDHVSVLSLSSSSRSSGAIIS